ncbi:hypothetical protein EMGR_003172 [Emarellia grisea]
MPLLLASLLLSNVISVPNPRPTGIPACYNSAQDTLRQVLGAPVARICTRRFPCLVFYLLNKPLRRQVTALRELKTKHADKASTWPILLGNNFLCLLAVDAYQTIAEDFADLIHPFRFNQAQQAAITRLRALPGGSGGGTGRPRANSADEDAQAELIQTHAEECLRLMLGQSSSRLGVQALDDLGLPPTLARFEGVSPIATTVIPSGRPNRAGEVPHQPSGRSSRGRVVEISPIPELNGSQQFNCHGFSTGVWTAWMLWTSRLDRAAALSCSKPSTLKTGLVAKAIKAGKTVDEKTLQHFYETEKVSAIETVGLSDAKTPHSSRTP